MAKIGYLFVTVLSFILFNSCANQQENKSPSPKSANTAQILNTKISQNKTPYGAYLAGRVAHQRKNFNAAANYYIQALKEDSHNQDLLSRIYLILVSEGRVDEAAKYAKLSLQKGDKNNITHIIIAIDDIKQQKYGNAVKTMNQLDGSVYKEFITPLINSWAYAGQNQPDLALKELSIISKEPSFKALYNFHAGMINDYFDRTTEARKHYEVIVNEESLEMSFRALQVITNFYLRNNEKDKAIALAKKYNDDKLMLDMLNKLSANIQASNPSETQKIITSPQIGVSEALFSIAATLRQGPSGVDLAHIFICLSVYSNPKYDLAKLLLADILENREMYEQANEVYNEINENSVAYFSAQIKKANNYASMEDYENAEILLKSLALEAPQNYQILLDLGDVLRMQNKPKEAINYYEEALTLMPDGTPQQWALYYALGISYDSDKQFSKAEQNLLKALELSQNNYLVLNYLGYSWLKQGKNIEESFGMIVDAYNQLPSDGHITDSLGWAFYQLGMYDKAIEYLEKAAELEPANALINDHLGDAYWQGGRKNEARFQWQHALTLPDDTGEVNRQEVKKKITNGIKNHQLLSFNKEDIDSKIAAISQD